MKCANLSDNFPMKFDVDKLNQELQHLQEGSWLEHYDPTLSRGWKSIPLTSRLGETSGPDSQRVAPYEEMRRTSIVDELPYIKSILDAFKCRHGRIRITRLDPGAGIDMHRDISDEVANIAFKKVRLHIPIQTNDGVYFWVAGDIIRMKPGNLYYVNFSNKHYVRNEGNTPRYHIVLDLEVNEWLMQFFPKINRKKKLAMTMEKTFLPYSWALINARVSLIDSFWRHYNGSRLQRIRHRLSPPNSQK